MPETLTLPALIFGNMARRAQSSSQRVAVVHAALDAGITTIDTAPLYDFGEAERQLGEALQGVPRDRVQILSKVGLRWDEGAAGEVLFREGGREVLRDSRPHSLTWQVEQSLERLGTDYLDLVQIHQPDRHTPIADSLGALDGLRQAGKVRAIGLCNFDRHELPQATASGPPVVSLQMPYNLLDRQVELDHLELSARFNLALLAYSPLAGGELARAEVRGVLEDVAAEAGLTPAGVALAWVLSKPGVNSALAGASTVDQIQTLAAVSPLNGELVQRLDNVFAPLAEQRMLGELHGIKRWRRRLRLLIKRRAG